MTTIGILLEPLDVLFFRDGKPFEPSTRAGGAWPVPQTLAGAIWTALLRQYDCDFDAFKQAFGQGVEAAVAAGCGDAQRWIARLAVRGPWLARIESHPVQSTGSEKVNPVEVLLPIPATVHTEKGAEPERLHLISPLSSKRSPVGWTSAARNAEHLRPLWHTGREATQPASGFLTPEGLSRFLHGQHPQPDQMISADKLYAHDYRTGIEIEPDRLTAAEGMIYGANFTAFNRNACLDDRPNRYDVAFYAELDFPDGAPSAVVGGIQSMSWGGEGRRVAVRPLARPFAWDESNGPQTPGTATSAEPRPSGSAGTQRPCLLLTTPGLFDGQPYPACLADHLIAAAVPAAVPVSGWDLARGGPKPLRFAAPAGSVYFLDELPENLGRSLCGNALDRQQGWGCYLKGTWTDE